jgi:hypothetical protein
MRNDVQTIVNKAAIAGSASASVPITVAIDRRSTKLFSSGNGDFILALPRTEGLVDAAVRVVGSLLARKLLLHPRHPGAE